MVSSIYNANLQITLHDGIPHTEYIPKHLMTGYHTRNIYQTQ